MKNVADGTEQHPQYVIDLQFSLFPSNSKSTWYLPNLRETFRPFLHRPDEAIPGINVPQMFLGQLGSFSCWQVEDLNLCSINKLHFGKPKIWIVVFYQHAEELTVEAAIPRKSPTLLRVLRSCDWHKGIAVLPQLLVAYSPPIPFRTLKQYVGDYVITCPSAFHFVINEGANVAEAMNFCGKEWKYYRNPMKGASVSLLEGTEPLKRSLKVHLAFQLGQII